MFGFGKTKKLESSIRAQLSQDKFAVEFEKTIAHYKIKPTTIAGKSAEFNDIQAAAQFILGGALDAAEKKLKSPQNLESAAAFSAALCDFLGRNGGLEDSEIKDLQSRVPAAVFPEAASKVMGARGESGIRFDGRQGHRHTRPHGGEEKREKDFVRHRWRADSVR